MFPREIIRNEVAIMQFILENTSDKIPIPIPVPSIARWVETKKSPSDLGPLIGMKYVQNVGSMGRLLEMLRRQGGQKPVLNLDLKPTRLEGLYRNLANIILSLSTLHFGQIVYFQE
jgi:hypothetical protein